MRIATVASVVMVLAMAAPAMAGDGSSKTDRRGQEPSHVRSAGDGTSDRRNDDRWGRDGSNRWNDWRRGDDDRRRGDHDWRHGDDRRRDVRDGDGRGGGDRHDRGRHLGHRKHDKDKKDNKDDRRHDRDERDRWHKDGGDDHREWRRAGRADGRDWWQTRDGR
jgi:hypothetical protein